MTQHVAWMSIGLGLVSLAGCGNRVLGSPVEYGQLGAGPMIGFFVVAAALAIAAVSLVQRLVSHNGNADIAFEDEREDQRSLLWRAGGAFLFSLAILQVLPPLGSGWMVLPYAPWEYATAGGAWIAGLAWLFLGAFFVLVLLAVAEVSEGRVQHARTLAASFALSLVFATLAGFCQLNPEFVAAQQPPPRPLTLSETLADIDDRLVRWSFDQERLDETLAKFRGQKREIVDRLRELGIDAATEVRGNERAELLADELKELATHIDMLDRKRAFYDTAVAKLESIRRRIARQAEIEQLAIIADEDQVNVALAKRELDDSLARLGESSIVRAMEVDEVLREALGE